VRGENRSEAMEAFPQWIIILIVVIALSRVAALLAGRFGLPSTSVQLLIGVLLGPSVFNLLGVPMVLGTWGSPSSGPLHSALKILAEIGLIQLMFLAGLGVDWRELEKILKLSFSVGAWGFVLTAVSVAIITRVFVDRWSEALAVSAIVSTSSFGISIYYFSEMKILGSRAAVTVSGAAILSGLLAILMMIASQATNYGVIHGAYKMTIAVSWFLGKLTIFFAVAYFLTSRFLKLVAKTGFEKRPRQMLIGYLLLVAALYAWSSMHFGSFAAVGVASLGGALLGLSNVEVKEKVAKGFGSVLASIPIGVLFVVIGMEVNLKEAGGYLNFFIVLLTAIVGAKLIGSWIATRREFDSFRERTLVIIGTLPQGEMGVLIAAYLFSRGLVNPSSFNAVIIVVIVLTMLTPIAMKVAQIKFNIQLNVAPSLTGGEEKHRSGVAGTLQRRE
jgi:Kef-type K+ transport system membrane component KefB